MWRELAGFGRHVVASEFLREVSSIANTALVGRFLGKAPLGHYRAAWRLTTQSTVPIMSASIMMLLPAFSRIAGDEARLRGGCDSRAEAAVRRHVPPRHGFRRPRRPDRRRPARGALAAAGAVLAALGGLIASLPLMQTASEVFKSVGQPAFLARSQLLSAVATIAMIVVFLPLGAAGVGGGVSIAGGIVAVYSAWSLARLFRVSLRGLLAELAPPGVAALGMGAILVVLDQLAEAHGTLMELGVLAAEAAVGTVVYLVLLAALKRSLVPSSSSCGNFARACLPGSLLRRSRTPTADADAAAKTATTYR